MNGEIFNSQEEVLIVTGCWREHYNRARPHSSPGYRLPVPETIKPACPIGSATLRLTSRLASEPRIILGIVYVIRHGLMWRDAPKRQGPPTTCYNRFVRWRKAWVWDRLLAAVSTGFNGELVLIGSTCVRVHQHGATDKKGGSCNPIRPVVEERQTNDKLNA